MPTRPFFVALEGMDGAGKDTVAAALSQHLRAHDLSVVLTAEPSDGPIGQKIRAMLDGALAPPSDGYAFQRLFVEDRRDHIDSCIRPHLVAGKIVISVRYWLSTIAYGMLDDSAEAYLKLHREVIGLDFLIPDLTVLLDVSPTEGLRRIKADGRRFDWFAKLEKLERIRANYLTLASRSDLGTILVVNAMESVSAVRTRLETLAELHYLRSYLQPSEKPSGT